MSKTLFVEVLLDQNLAKGLDYQVPPDLQKKIEIGMRVEVPLKNQLRKGTVASIKDHSRFPNVKSIARLLSTEAELSDPLWKLAQWMSGYYCAPLQRVLKCFIPPSLRREVKPKTRLFLQLAQSKEETARLCEELRTKKPVQASVFEILLKAGKGMFFSDLAKEIPLTRAVLQRMIEKKWIDSQHLTAAEDLLLEEEFFPSLPKELNGEQQECLKKIEQSLAENRFAAHLIHGVTGSGKTEVYMQAIQAALSQNKSAIMLVPEVSLTSQTIERFRTRFSEKIAILHHRRSLGERSAAWDLLKKGEARIAIGARSAVFCPTQNLGLIIVDEEHDSSYKQSDESPSYQGRDVAVMRGHLENCTVLLGSATPSVESRYNAEIGKYQFHILKTRASAHSVLPSVRIIDMKKAFDRAGGFTHFSDELLEALKQRLKTGEQTLLFLNRRGYHRMQVCGTCRHVIKCPHCDLALAFHRGAGWLQCHLCDFKQPSPRGCPACQSPESLQFKGFGTEHVERSLHAIFPEIRTLRMDRDTTSQKDSHEILFKQFRSHKADVLIGTQMIAKGFHFPAVTLVGVLNADATLSIPDFRSSEQVFQIITQVAGRAGRSELPGEVILQTFLPEHPTILLASKQDYPGFYSAEIEERRTFGYPPFSHLIKLLFSDADPERARKSAETAYELLKTKLAPPTQVLPVAPAGHPKVKDLYRYQFLIKTAKIKQASSQIVDLRDNMPSCEIKIDVDPLSTFF